MTLANSAREIRPSPFLSIMASHGCRSAIRDTMKTAAEIRMAFGM
jgi:hypothetical protein